MPSDLTNDQIALLCAIGEHTPSDDADSGKRRDLQRLLAEGYVKPATGSPSPAFELTPEGLDFLGKRGAGLNEA